MILYGMSISPFVRKVMVYLAEKGLPVEMPPHSPMAPSPEFLAISPFRKMPAFSDGDFGVCDSTAIITYLEAKYPTPALIPADPASRAKTIWFEEFADTIVAGLVGKIFFNRVVMPKFMGKPGDDAVADAAAKDEFPPMVDYLESVVPASGFLVEDRLTLADIAVASPFVNLSHAGVNVDGATHPKAYAYLDGILGRPSYAPIIEQEMAFFAN